MAVIRFPAFGGQLNLFQEMARLSREMDQLVSSVMGRFPRTGGFRAFPPVNVIDEDDKILVYAEVPGVKPEDVRISVQGDTLSITGERKREDLGDVGYHRRERPVGRFQKTLTLPVEINSDAVEARYEHGVLKLTLPKAEHARPKRIAVRTS